MSNSRRVLGIFDATSMVTGNMIGSGIFLLVGFAAQPVTSDFSLIGESQESPILDSVLRGREYEQLQFSQDFQNNNLFVKPETDKNCNWGRNCKVYLAENKDSTAVAPV